MPTAPRRSGDRQDGHADLRVPNRYEQLIARTLLEKTGTLSGAARTQIEQISRGEPVHDEALDLMWKIVEMYVSERLATRDHSIE
jgi:hypothetical protein